MDGLTDHAPMTRLLRERGVFDHHPFVLIDVGCAGGIDDAWRAFGPTLVARAYRADVAACEHAQAGEPFDNVRYQPRRVGLPDTHPFVQRRREDAAHWPNTNIWGRITAGFLAERAQTASPPAPPPIADPDPPDPDDVIGVDDIVRSEALPTVDFLKIDVDGPDVEVLESARDVLAASQVLGVGMEVNWFGSANPTEHTFHNTDRFLREQGFTLFGFSCRRYSRTDLPAPFETEAFAHTHFGQPYQGDAVYVRDLAADHLAPVAAYYSPDKLIKLACLYELIGLPDCAAEVLNRFKRRVAEFGDREPLLDALTPPLLGEQVSYREYIARFERNTELFLPSAAKASPEASAVSAGVPRAPMSIRRPPVSLRSLQGKRPSRAAVAGRARSLLVERAPDQVLQSLARALARGRPLALDPEWRFRVPGDDEGQLVLLKRDIWAHYCDTDAEAPVVFRWYDGLRVRLYLGNDLSLCLFVLGAYEPNAFMFLRTALQPGMVVVDGGANEGLFTLFAAQRVGPEGTVLSVEPSTREFERLEANIEINRLGNVKAFKVALGSRAGEVVLAVAEPRHAGMNTVEPRDPGHSVPLWTESTEAVSLETIDEIVARSGLARLDLVKLDIEGSEVDALDGAHAAIARFRPIILLEAEEERLAQQGRTKEDLTRALDELGYDLWVFDAGSAQLRRAEPPREPEGNAIAAPRGWQPPVLG
jgi:FkbM family methyltransferase